MARVEPPLVEKPDAVLESLRRYFGPADKSEPTVDLDRKFVVNLKEILALKEEKRSLDAQVKALETRIQIPLCLHRRREWYRNAKEPCETGRRVFQSILQSSVSGRNIKGPFIRSASSVS
mgnify:CR=1 FL=1